MEIEGLATLQPEVLTDERGYFFEAFNHRRFTSVIGQEVAFVQDNESRSRQNVIRGLHYQLPPHSQGKLVRCIVGAVWDVAVDLRRDSATFGDWVAIELTSTNHKQLWIPSGFAHGFLTLSEEARLLYKTTDYYSPASTRSIRWDDPRIGIEWPIVGEPVLSLADSQAPLLEDAEVF